jgi:hypothetical protein
MSDDNLKQLFDQLEDFANGLEAMAVKLKVGIAKIQGVEPKKAYTWNPDKIQWTKAQGGKGEYERSEDLNNPDFKEALKDLADHKGSLYRQGWFYWSFKNGSTIGRKKKVKGQ